MLAIGFKTSVRGEPSPTDDVARIRWVSAEVLDDLDFAGSMTGRWSARRSEANSLSPAHQ